jgi:serine/threonine protein kinase
MKPPVVAGKYTLLRRLGHGGMAEVFLAKQAGEGGFEKLVVLKRILPHLASGSEFTSMFLDEARIAADLRHPNIVTVVDTGRSGDSLFMVMEFLHGQDVRKVQRKVAAFGQHVPFGHACQITIAAAAGLHYAHAKRDLHGRPLSIVHRDVSPQNILVTFEGGTKIVDFGIAKAVGQTSHTSTGILKGKYTYMSPEQAEGQTVDARTDQYALGIVFWELLTMRRLLKRDTEAATIDAVIEGNVPRPRRFRDDCPAALEEVVMTALARDKTQRFRDCEEMALALEDALARETIVHSPSRLSQYLRRLFADQLAEEASLGIVSPEGALSVRTMFGAVDRPPAKPEGEAQASTKPPSLGEEHEPAALVADATQADRRRSASRSGDSSRESRREKSARAPGPASGFVLGKEGKESTRASSREPPAGKEKEAPLPHTLEPPSGEAPLPASRATLPTQPSRMTTSPARSHREPPARGASFSAAKVAVAMACLSSGLVFMGFLAVRELGRSPGPAHLIVRTEPRGARVFLDGADTGQVTPALLRGVRSGEPHKVHVELSGFGAVDEVIVIEARDSTFELKLDLNAAAR